VRSRGRFLVLVAFLFLTSRLAAEAATYRVDRLTDANPAGGGVGSGHAGDLRYCINKARSGDIVAFDVVGTVHLAAALPTLTWNITIQGPAADKLTVRGAGSSVLHIGSGKVIVVSGVTVTGGSSNGGGILNQGTLTLNDVTIRDNTAGDATNGGGTGAGLWNYIGAHLTIRRSTISDNTAIGNLGYNPSRGGGIANYGTATLINSTISGNSANEGSGGGISNSLPGSTLTIKNATVSANASPGTFGGGGIDNLGTLNSTNSIVGDNGDGDLSGDVESGGYNIFGTTNGTGFDPTDLIGADPLLGPLKDNGGPTDTMAPLPGSPAINRIPGSSGVDFPTTDQRGVTRPQGARADSGAVELVPSSATPTRTRTPSRTPTRTFTATKTPTKTKTPTRTFTASKTPTKTRTPTRTPTRTFTASKTPTKTKTPTRTPTRTFTASRTPTRTRTPSRTPTPALLAGPSSGGAFESLAIATFTSLQTRR